MSIYYAYLNNVDSSTVITAEYWNALVGEEQATDDLLIGSMYPWAMVNSVSSTPPNEYWLTNNSSSWIRYYETSGVFENPNNQKCVEVETINPPSFPKFIAHKILVPGLYAWNIGWGERWFDVGLNNDDQVISVKVKKCYQGDLLFENVNNFSVLSEYRSITTSWAISNLSHRYIASNFSTSFGIGYPLRSYSGMHFFNAPPYSKDFEYIIFEFSSSIILTTPVRSLYYNTMIGPNITLMKVR